MRLLALCLTGLSAELTQEQDEAADQLAEWLEPLLGCVRVGLPDLEDLDPLEVEALARACRARELRLAAWHGLAAQGAGGTAALAAEQDGGEALGRLRLARGLRIMDSEEADGATG